jgi:hypothetical protein
MFNNYYDKEKELRKKLSDNLDPNEIFNLHASIGETLWHIQGFENSLIYYTALVFKMEIGIAEKEAYAILEQLNKKTLGQLLNDLRKHNNISPSMDLKFQKLLEERNWLVHKSRNQCHTDVYSPEKLIKLKDRLENLKRDALSFNKELCKLIETFMVSKGFTTDDILKVAEQNINNWLKTK